MEDVDKLDSVQDGFIHYQLLRFCQATRLQYLNGQVPIENQNHLQQQHDDYKIAEALLKKGTGNAYQTWTLQDRAWVDMVLSTKCSTSPTSMETLASLTTPSADMQHPTLPTPGSLPSWTPLPSLRSRSGCQATSSTIPPHG